MILFQFSLERTGSTWQFNAIKNILKLKNKGSQSFFFDPETILNYQNSVNDFEFNVLKCHTFNPDLFKYLISLGKIKVLATKRDIRKVIPSYIRFINPEASLLDIDKRIGNYFDCLEMLNSYPILITKEENFVDYNSLVEISDYIGISISETEARDLSSALSKDAVRSKIDDIFGGEEDINLCHQDTQWHPQHISDIEESYEGDLTQYPNLIKYQEWGK